MKLSPVVFKHAVGFHVLQPLGHLEEGLLHVRVDNGPKRRYENTGDYDISGTDIEPSDEFLLGKSG